MTRVAAVAAWAGVTLLTLGGGFAAGQPLPQPAKPPAAPAEQTVSTPPDPLNRDTPRGTVLNFLNAAREGKFELAREYLDIRPGADGETVARQLFVVLDAKLPARLPQISDRPEGSQANPLTPDVESIGIIESRTGNVDVVLQRVHGGRKQAVWLFSSHTLGDVPRLYDEVSQSPASTMWPRFLTETRIGSLRTIEWLVVLLGIPLFFVATALLNRVLLVVIRPLWRHFAVDDHRTITNVLPTPARLLLLAVLSQSLLSTLPLSLMVRQFWSTAVGVVSIVAVVWLLIILNGEVEGVIRRRVKHRDQTATAALLRVLRRVVDVVLIVAGIAFVLRYFGVQTTPALAGLGVGGIAVALAAQKTLENVIAGASLIFDQAVRVGDFLRVGETAGTVDHIGLRSTRIRTLDRTVVSIPNGQIANASLETVSGRDKFWFHPEVKLRYETTSAQLHAVLDGIRRLLETHPAVQRADHRVRFHRLGPYSLDIEVFAYVAAADWDDFLRIQEELLFGVTEAVERSGSALAVPAQMPPAPSVLSPSR